MVMQRPTRSVKQITHPNGDVETTELDAVASVEIGENTKGEPSIKSVKAYAPTVEEAGRLALAEYRRLKIAMAPQ